MKICSVVPLLDLNPACSLRCLSSIPIRIRSITIIPNILLTTGRRVTPRQFLHSLKFPFFGTLIMSPLFHLSGTFSRFQIVSVSSLTLSGVNSRSAFSSSAVVISSPGALPFLRLFISCPSYLSFAHRSRVYVSYALLFTIFFIDLVGWLLPIEYLPKILFPPLPSILIAG